MTTKKDPNTLLDFRVFKIGVRLRWLDLIDEIFLELLFLRSLRDIALVNR